MGWRVDRGVGEFDGWRLSEYRLADDEFSDSHREFWGGVGGNRVWRVFCPLGYIGAARAKVGAKDLAEVCRNSMWMSHLGEPKLGVRVERWGRYNAVRVVLRTRHAHAWLEYPSHRSERSNKNNAPIHTLPVWTVATHLRRRWRGIDRPAKDEQQFAVWEDVLSHAS